MAKIDSLLKTLQVRPSPAEALVQAYLIHIADRSETNFRKILELKGIRRVEQTALVDIFTAHSASPTHSQLPQSGPLLTPLQITSGSHQATGIGSLKDAASITTPSLAGGRFDPATFGSAIMNAAREGVDRFGSPAIGTGSTSARENASSPPPAGTADASTTGNLNENLRNLGRFFKREGGSSGGFWKKDG